MQIDKIILLENTARYIVNLKTKDISNCIRLDNQIHDLYDFLFSIISTTTFRLKPDHIILLVYFLERLVVLQPRAIYEEMVYLDHVPAWKGIILSLLIIVSKMYEEYTVHIKDFLMYKKIATVDNMCKLELKILNILDYNLSINMDSYKKLRMTLRFYEYYAKN